MREKLKQFWRVLVLAMVVLLAGCAKEEFGKEFDAPRMQLNVTVTSYNELMKKREFVSAYEKIPKTKVAHTNEFGKSVIEETFGFTIVEEEPVKVVEMNEIETYTLKIITDGSTDSKLENLVLFSEPYKGELGFIIKYNSPIDSSLSEQAIKESGILEMEGLLIANPVTKIIYMTYWLPHCICSPGSYQYCGGDPSDTNFTLACGDWWASPVYIDDAGGGGDAGSGNTGSGDTGGGFGGVPTSPVGGGTIGSSGGGTSPDPCKKMNTISTDAEFRTRFNTLNSSSKFNQINESGFGKRITVNSDGTQTITYQVLSNANGGSAVRFPPNGIDSSGAITSATVCVIHVHTDIVASSTTFPVLIFSPSDISGLLDMAQNAESLGLGFSNAYLIMLSSQGTYAIQLTDTNYDVSSVDWHKLRNIYLEKAALLMDSDGYISQNNLKKIFFEILKLANLDGKVALLKASNVTPNSTSVPDWRVINPDTLQEEPCL